MFKYLKVIFHFKYYLIIFLTLTLVGCNAVKKQVNERLGDSTARENAFLEQFINATADDIVDKFGKPDKIEPSSEISYYVYEFDNSFMKCERRFKLNEKNIVIGFTSSCAD